MCFWGIRMDGEAGFTVKQEPRAFWVDDDNDWAEADIPQRDWIVPGFLLRGVVTMIIGCPAVGKSVLGLLWAIVLALGENHGRFRTKDKKYRVVVLNAEDPLHEQRRRVAALMKQYGGRPSDLGDRLIRIGPEKLATLFVKGETGAMRETAAFAELRSLIHKQRTDVLILDPLAELSSGNAENSNDDMNEVIALLRSLAIDEQIAVLIVHHAKKGVVTPGDLDASRGASSTGGAVRGAFTLTGMTEEDAFALGINAECRHNYIKLADAKSSYAPLSAATWYERFNIELANGDGAPTLRPWQPPEDKVTPDIRAAIEAGIARGIGGEPWSPMLGSRPRSVKHLMVQHGVTTSDGQKKLLIELLAAGFEKVEFKSSNRRWDQGLRTPDGKPAVKWKVDGDE